MKFYNSIFILIFAFSNIYSGSITKAIEKLEIEKVKILLDSKSISQQRKEKYLNIIESAIKKHSAIIKGGLLKSYPDLMSISAGTGLSWLSSGSVVLFCLACLVMLDELETNIQQSQFNLILAALSGWFTWITAQPAGKMIYDGVNMRYAYNNLSKANEIKKLITSAITAQA